MPSPMMGTPLWASLISPVAGALAEQSVSHHPCMHGAVPASHMLLILLGLFLAKTCLLLHSIYAFSMLQICLCGVRSGVHDVRLQYLFG